TRARVTGACTRAGRDPSEITLVGACKRQPVERIAAAVCAGLDQLGENYVQAAQTTQAALRACLEAHFSPGQAARPTWRMIGHLQRNKASQAVDVFGCVDTVDNPRLARALAGRAQAAGVDLEICLQVNLSGESTKSGCSEAELEDLLSDCAALPALRVVGLMTMPAPGPAPESARDTFARLRGLRDTLQREPGGARLQHLNMGMSADLEVAIEEGATLVRVGTDLFGERTPRAPGLGEKTP
ncbi:MAG: YggS family pyridoxal phosphate-dependent enzyme, partial [Myxococcota bacterium]|nr:YggS family pyridoxal phosphate-dependent enzyme [Myxococcota bacterium]